MDVPVPPELPPLLELEGRRVIWLPAGESAYQGAPNAVTPCPATSPAFLSPA